MIFFGHLGIGNALITPFRRGLSRKWILFGTVFSDVFDKSLYYGLVAVTGKHGLELAHQVGPFLGPISGTRTFGHTAMVLMGFSILALILKSKRLAALAMGISTHLFLDGLSDHFIHTAQVSAGPTSALLWPFTGLGFPVIPYQSVHEHVLSWKSSFLIFSELAGLILLGADYRGRIRQVLKKAKVGLQKGVGY